MIPAALRRLLLTGAATVLACAAAVVLAAPALGFRWDPFDRAKRRISDLEARLAQVEAAAAAAARLARAEADQAVRVEFHHRRSADAARVVADLIAHSTESPDARLPLPADRAARLHDADRRLCGLAPDACAAGAPQPSDGGDGVLSPPDVAGNADPGGP